MKAIKIILAVVVVSIIGFFVWKWAVKIDKPTNVAPATNQFTTRVESEIDSLKVMSDKDFCPEMNKNIQYLIDDYYKQGFLGENDEDNKEWKEILMKNLYSAYAPKFVDQAMYVFKRSEWPNEKLLFIRNEVQALKKSEYLESGSPIDNSFDKIQTILAKYDEINAFISGCLYFSFTDTDIYAKFPDMGEKIRKSKSYISNNLDNSYVNHCIRLKENLKKIPMALFEKHTSYLMTKINLHGCNYRNYRTHSIYVDAINKPLKEQINALNRSVYDIDYDTFNREKGLLENRLSSYNSDAYNYLRKKY